MWRVIASVVIAAAAAMDGGIAARGSTPPPLHLSVTNDAGMDPAKVAVIEPQFREWGEKVYRYFGETPGAPVKVVFSKHAGPGLYVGDQILIAPDDQEMLETWIHELAHHVTGHESTFLLKEGVATHAVEALFAQEHRVPMGWPNYGQTCDAWVSLFLARGQMQRLADANARDGFRGFPAEQDFRSWQVYCIGGSFTGWLIRTRGLAAFRAAFAQGTIAPELEAQWLDAVRKRELPAFNPAQFLPKRPRYQRYVERLSTSPAGK